jgi:predicted AAA+ superfamily ATPase
MKEYRNRIVDYQLREELRAFGAVSIVGPKWCGKTTTAKQLAKSVLYMQDTEKSKDYLQIAGLRPSALLEGENPRLIDEWQMAPQLWDAVRFDIDMRDSRSLYILTGSTSVDEGKIAHSGAGRITRMRMRTMSLYESGDSSGEVSLGLLFSGAVDIDGQSKSDIRDVARLIVRGGWPGSVGSSDDIVRRQVRGYCETILESDVFAVDGVKRDGQRMRAVLRSMSRNVSTSATNATILNDVTSAGGGAMHINTLNDYINALKKIYVVDDLPAWSPKLRSKTAIRTSDTRHLADPAIAAYFLGAGVKDLEFDPNTFGLLFESMVIRDLRVYSQALDGDVYHYRDKDDLEADAVIRLHDGRWCAMEAKLGSAEVDKAAKNLKRLENKVDAEAMNPPSFLAVITGTGFAYTREDGVHVIPIGCLKD